MAVTAEDFKNISLEIGKEVGSEIHRRTAASRAYYAAFHHARRTMAKLGWDTDSHDALIRYMTIDFPENQSVGQLSKNVKSAGLLLKKFKIIRTHADDHLLLLFSLGHLSEAKNYSSKMSQAISSIETDIPQRTS